MGKLPLKLNTTDEEKSWSTNFNQNVARNEKGRSVVQSPFKDSVIVSWATHIHLQLYKYV